MGSNADGQEPSKADEPSLSTTEANNANSQANAFLRSSSKHNLSSSSNLLPSCALVKKNMITEFAEALTPL
ncbi:hypothetical protein Tco_0212654 [Tanacetum coccineum]